MIVITVNTGSTSVKLAAYELVGSDAPRQIAHSEPSGEALDAAAVLQDFFSTVGSRPGVVAHRVVHGGTRFPQPVRIDQPVLSEIRALSELAPLHNPKAVKWIEASQAVCGPGPLQIAAFDTSFFAKLPRVAAEYALPTYLATEHGVRRYGFHGLAHEAMLERWQQLRPELPRGGRLITLQLGGGCSIAAIRAGEPVDTSMGFSPLEGLVMATRSGDIDPAVVPYLQKRLGQPGAPLASDRVIELLNHDAGLKGLSGGITDFRTLLGESSVQSSATGGSSAVAGPGSTAASASFAVDLYCYRARKYIGAYLAVLGGCDGIVFGGGVGEHVPAVREHILGELEWAGVRLDPQANRSAAGAEERISAADSKIGVHVITVDEERVLVRAAARLA